MSLDSLRRQPFRLLFPVGVALAWPAVGHWALHAAGWLADYRPRFHAIAQTQGFMTCMAIGFLFMMIPRRTETDPPTTTEVILGAAGPTGVVIAAWLQLWVLAQLLWLATAAMVVRFILARFDGPGEARRPNGFVWIPAAFLMGIAGSLIQLTGEITTLSAAWARIGSGLTRQGFLVGLILGVGGALALPLMTRGEGPPAREPTSRDRLAQLAHLLGAAALATSFWVEATVSLRLAMLVRAAVATGILTGAAQLWRPPRRTGANARIVWLAAWLLPAGYLLAALWPQSYRAGLHVSFLGGFALLGFAISAQVMLGHGGYTQTVRGWPVAAISMFLLMGAAIGARTLMELDRARTFVWMGSAAALFLLATAAWLHYVWPAIFRPRGD